MRCCDLAMYRIGGFYQEKSVGALTGSLYQHHKQVEVMLGRDRKIPSIHAVCTRSQLQF